MDVLLAVVVLGVIVGFPAWAGYVVFKRGSKRWAIATWLLILTVYGGVIVGALALYKTAGSAGRPLKEPCPECGSQEGSTIKATLDRKTGAWMRPLPAVIYGTGGLTLIALGLVMAVLAWVGGDVVGCGGGTCLEWENGATIAGFGFLAMGLVFGSLLARPARRFLATDRVRGVRSECKGCGHVWVIGEGLDGLPPSMPGVLWLSYSDDYLWGRNSEKTSYYVFDRTDLSEPLLDYSDAEKEEGKEEFRKLAGTWWSVVAQGPTSSDVHAVSDARLPPRPDVHHDAA